MGEKLQCSGMNVQPPIGCKHTTYMLYTAGTQRTHSTQVAADLWVATNSVPHHWLDCHNKQLLHMQHSDVHTPSGSCHLCSSPWTRLGHSPLHSTQPAIIADPA